MTSLDQARQILAGLRQSGIAVRCLRHDSRLVKPGDVFLAMPGTRVDGRAYIGDAVQRGAAAVLAEAGDGLPVLHQPLIVVEHLQQLSGWLAAEVYDHPSRHINVIGITGTNGKTSISQWLAQILTAQGKKTACIGTLGSGLIGNLSETSNTTPDALSLQESLAHYRLLGCEYCVIEVSSIGLAEGRCNATRFETALFTNLNRDHLDYHGTMEEYGSAKERLFNWPDLEAAVINLDDPFGSHLIEATKARKKIGCTLKSTDKRLASSMDTLLAIENLEEGVNGLSFSIHVIQRKSKTSARVNSTLIGRHNAENMLSVTGALVHAGIGLDEIAKGLEKLTPVSGRLQQVNDGIDEPMLIVDYAHKPGALKDVLKALRPIVTQRKGRLFCLFGCGGNRDRGKRRQMGEIAALLADAVYLTDDNPRDENPMDILSEIASGAPNACVIPGRATAIDTAVADCQPQDVLLIAGKGHENYQEIAGVKHYLSDVECAQQSLQQWRTQHGRRRGE